MDLRQFPKLSTTLIGSAIAAFVLALVAVSLPIRTHVGVFERNVQSEGVIRAGRALQLATSRAVEREWDSLNAVARQVSVDDVRQMRGFADAVVRASDGIAWVGVASRSGTVLAGTDRLREGEDVSSRRWFREGLDGGSVGSVFVPESADSPGAAAGLINMSVPVFDSYGTAAGVVAYSMRIDWLTGYMSAAARELGLDFAVRAADGSIVTELGDQIGAPFDRNIADLATVGHNLTRYVSGSGDVPAHVTGVFPNLLAGDLPPFGWDLIVRVPALQGQASLVSFMRKISWSVAGLFLALTIATVVYTLYFIRPIEQLARTAAEIARGEDVYPRENMSSRESVTLSSALAMIQTKLMDRASLRIEPRRITPGE